jgi:hypothetical protein
MPHPERRDLTAKNAKGAKKRGLTTKDTKFTKFKSINISHANYG